MEIILLLRIGYFVPMIFLITYYMMMKKIYYTKVTILDYLTGLIPVINLVFMVKILRTWIK